VKTFVCYLLFLTLAMTSYGQDTLIFYYLKNGRETSNIDRSEYYRIVVNYGDRYSLQEFLTASNHLIQSSELKSWEPLIENGLTTYYDKASNQFLAKGYYLNGNLSGEWIFRTNKGYDTIYYSNEEVTYLPSKYPSQQTTYWIVEEMPLFENTKPNQSSFEKHIHHNLFYPVRARQNGIKGTVFVQFVVDEDGKVVETGIVRGVEKDLDKEAVRVVNSMTNWTPGKQRGENVRVAFAVGVKFE
jgi:TonB family protein